ncbi:hypothetical protein C1645_834975 [Glomus cerebriforme]|uniref:Uncharacterized protein n=1 Tax=Glomus cerebriforme TaxID=658196 RepID=A0A397S8Q5_9GLOM|nr:hypothetical protein C1645_834975 [Glomus cerebriforme]
MIMIGGWVAKDNDRKPRATISQHIDLFYNEYIASLEAKNFCHLEWDQQESFLKKHNLWVNMKQGTIVNNTARLVKAALKDLHSKEMLILELTANLKKIPIIVENPHMEISSESTSTNNTNNNTPDNEVPNSVNPPLASNSKVKQSNRKMNKELTLHIVTGYIILSTLKKNVPENFSMTLDFHFEGLKVEIFSRSSGSDLTWTSKIRTLASVFDLNFEGLTLASDLT